MSRALPLRVEVAQVAAATARVCASLKPGGWMIFGAFATTVTHVLAVAADRRRPGYWATRK